MDEKELSIISNTEFLLTKTIITGKIYELLAHTRDELKQTLQKQTFVFPDYVDTLSGKIAKGESYRGLPFIVLDYPRFFSKKSVFAFRTLFWWGNEFSFTMHLQGEKLQKYRSLLIRNTQPVRNKGFYICVNSSPWEYHFGKDNYLYVDKLSEKELCDHLQQKDFIKISRKLELKRSKNLPEFSKESFEILLSLLLI